MKFATKHNRRKIRASADLTPLIDVVFQLLIFFMLSSTFVVQASIPIEVSEAKGATSYEHKDISVTLQYDPNGPGGRGPIYVNEDEVADMGELSRVLSSVHAERPEVMVLVRPDARVETAQLVEVLGIATSVGVKNLGIAAQPPAEEQ